MRVRETNMCDGVDKVWSWSSVKSAKASGRFDYLKDEVNDDGVSLWKLQVRNAKSVEELIKNVGYPFSLEK